MPTSYYAGFDIVTRDADGYLQSFANETIVVKKLDNSTLATLTTDDYGFISGGSLSVAVGTKIKFTHSVKTLIFEQVTQATADIYLETATFIIEDNDTRLSPAVRGQIWMRDASEANALPIYLGEAFPGSTLKAPIESAKTKSLKLFLFSENSWFQLNTTDFNKAESVTVNTSGTAIETGGVTGSIQFNDNGVLTGNSNLFWDTDNNRFIVGYDSGFGAKINARILSATEKGMVIRQHASQSANPFEIQTSAGGSVFAVKPNNDLRLFANGTDYAWLDLRVTWDGSQMYFGFGGQYVGISPAFRGIIGGTTYSPTNQSVNQNGTGIHYKGYSAGQGSYPNYSVHYFNSDTTISTAGLKLLAVANNGTEKLYVDKDGLLYSAGGLTLADGKNLVFGTTTGTQIGTSSTQKLGFFGVTPVSQPTITGTTLQEQIDSLVSALENLGLVNDGR